MWVGLITLLLLSAIGVFLSVNNASLDGSDIDAIRRAFSPGSGQANTQEKQVFIQKLLNDELSIADCNGYIEANPNDVDGYKWRGVLLLTQFRHGEAISDFNRGIAAEPRDPYSYFYRARAYESLGKVDAAIRDLNQVLILDPDDRAARWALAKLYASQNKLQLAKSIDPDIVKLFGSAQEIRTHEQSIVKLDSGKYGLVSNKYGIPKHWSETDSRPNVAALEKNYVASYVVPSVSEEELSSSDTETSSDDLSAGTSTQLARAPKKTNLPYDKSPAAPDNEEGIWTVESLKLRALHSFASKLMPNAPGAQQSPEKVSSDQNKQ